jgi:hypothetical protein
VDVVVVELGRLEQVDPRAIWTHEARDFTPWLLASSDVLSEALGMDLDLEAAEHRVGEFSLDLIGTDRANGGVVIVENQLGVSDHEHLGQILTYAGGTNPVHVVWIATGFREEHRAALEWLNDRTDETTRFFAVQLQAVRIGGSPPAPALALVVRPNDWGKQVRASTGSGRGWTREDFFGVLEDIGDQSLLTAARRLYEHTLSAGAGASAYWGSGRRPSMTAQIPAGSLTLQPWSFYIEGGLDGGPVLAINFDWIYKGGRGADEAAVVAFAERLQNIAAVVPYVDPARRSGWRKRPSIPAAAVFRDPDAVDAVIEALDGLYDAVARGAEGEQSSLTSEG